MDVSYYIYIIRLAFEGVLGWLEHSHLSVG